MSGPCLMRYHPSDHKGYNYHNGILFSHFPLVTVGGYHWWMNVVGFFVERMVDFLRLYINLIVQIIWSAFQKVILVYLFVVILAFWSEWRTWHVHTFHIVNDFLIVSFISRFLTALSGPTASPEETKVDIVFPFFILAGRKDGGTLW